MSVCKVHNVRFYKPKPKAVYCMSLQNELKKLALSRSDASIEIWNLEHSPFIERTIASSIENYSIEGLSWKDDRLFSVGLHGFLVEYDMKKLCVKNKTSVTGQTAFCLDVNRQKTLIAVGTEQGYLNIFSITDDWVMFEKFLDKQQGRILCLKFDYTGQFLATGSLDAVRIWDVKSGHALHRMTTARAERHKATIIWCLGITQDFTVISGDSRGKISFWDGKNGGLLESYQSHKADVLSLSLSEDGKKLYCAGIDPNIMSYERIHVKNDSYKWVKSIQRKIHSHDVRALVVVDNKLYSGGADGYLACSFHPPKTLMKYPPIMEGCVAVTSSETRFILLKHPKYVEIWKLGESDGDLPAAFSKTFSLKRESKKLLILQRRVQSLGKEKKEGIISCSMSNNGNWIVFSTQSILRLFNFKYEDDCTPELILNENLPEECGVSLKTLFTPNSQQLILVTRDGNIQIVGLKSVPVLLQTIETESYLSDVIGFILCTPCGQFIIAADAQSNIAVWKNIDNAWKFYCKLPKYDCPLTAINAQPKTMNVVLVYCDHMIFEYNLYERKLTQFSKELFENDQKLFVKNWPVRNITFDPRNDNVVILHDDSNIVIINKDKKPTKKDTPKMAKIATKANLNKSAKGAGEVKYSVDAIKKYKHLVHLGWLSNDEMVAVEVNPLVLLDQAPPAFNQKTFGTK